MSQQPISHSPDLKRLRDEGYDLDIKGGYLLVRGVPYVNAGRAVRRGTIVAKLMLAGDVTVPPDDHVAHFEGEYPCREDGSAIEQIRNQSGARDLADGVRIDHTFSAKPKPAERYADYYAKMTAYVAILSGPAQRIDPTVTAQIFPVIESENADDSVFHYIDTASSRAEITPITNKLGLGKIAIVGLGGTGSYVLDLVAKTPVKEIHLFDGDTFLQHNAFRSPGAPAIDELKLKLPKTTHFTNLYSQMRRGIIDHPTYVDAGNVDTLREMAFVFLCLDRGAAKKLIIQKLEEANIPFVDTGMGVNLTDDFLGGILRITTSTPAHRDHIRDRIPFTDSDGPNEYDRNIQIADLNALNATLAVIKWKKLFGFYRDVNGEHHTTYTIDGNLLLNAEGGP